LSGARESARDTRRASDFDQFRTAVQAYKSDTGDWPGSGDNSGTRVSSECDGNDIYADLVNGGHLQEMPTDPVDSVNTCSSVSNVGGSEEYFYSWDGANAGGYFCFGINEFAGDVPDGLSNFNQADQNDMGNNGNLSYAEFVYCFQDE